MTAHVKQVIADIKQVEVHMKRMIANIKEVIAYLKRVSTFLKQPLINKKPDFGPLIRYFE